MIHKHWFIAAVLFFILTFLTLNLSSGMVPDNGVYLTFALKVRDFDTTGYSISKGS